MAEARAIDLDNQCARVFQGSKRAPQWVSYDHLAIAVGLKTRLDVVPGMPEHALTMKDSGDAHAFRNHIIQCLEHADVTGDPDLKRRLLTLVVAGGGFSGVETMGEVAEMIFRTLNFYPHITSDEICPILVHCRDRLLPELPEKLGGYARQKLEKRGIKGALNSELRAVTVTKIELGDHLVPTLLRGNAYRPHHCVHTSINPGFPK